ncbi:MAG TPA: peptide chain release factor N(5)-glutamine methyltransferase [Blastocatellia bacterium]|nr:peptide chain release factor N(5)-glutamine methyltransferase [Blastocatellia bacterium]
MPTIVETIAEGAARLGAAGVAEARRTAGVLLGHALGLDRAYLLTRPHEEVDEARYQEYLRLVERRAAGEPLQYITGHQEFYGLDFIVKPGALIPRPETEFLVERVINLAQAETAAYDLSDKRGQLIVDVGTGSGCIAVTVAAFVKNARVIAIDISRAAIEVARANAERHNVADRIEFLEGDLLEPLQERAFEASVDFIASNPPYVDESKPELVQREVRDWEPRVALYGGADGLDFYRRLLNDAPKYLKPRGYMIIEIGYSQLDAIRNLIDATALELIDVTSDLQGIPRTLTLRKPGE